MPDTSIRVGIYAFRCFSADFFWEGWRLDLAEGPFDSFDCLPGVLLAIVAYLLELRPYLAFFFFEDSQISFNT